MNGGPRGINFPPGNTSKNDSEESEERDPLLDSLGSVVKKTMKAEVREVKAQEREKEKALKAEADRIAMEEDRKTRPARVAEGVAKIKAGRAERLERDARIAENEENKLRLREQIKSLEARAKTSSEAETELLALENNLRALEKYDGSKPAPAPSETAPTPAVPESVPVAEVGDVDSFEEVLDAPASPESRKEKYAKLGELVHEYDAVMKKALGEEDEPVSPVKVSSDSYEGDANHPVPKTMEGSYEGDAHYPVPALKEGLYDGEPNYPVPAVIQEGGRELLVMPDELKPSKIEIAREAVALERAEMLQAETQYLAAYKSFQKKNGLVRFWKENVMGSNSAELARLRDFKSKYDGARSRYAQGLNDSVVKRLEAKGKSPAEIEKILKRYNGIVRFNEIVKPSKERQLQAHGEALNQRGQDALSGAFNYAARLNQSLDKKLGKNGARAVRVLASTLLVTGGAAALGSFAAGGIVAALGYGGFRLARSLIGSFAGAAAGELYGAQYEKNVAQKEQDKAKAALEELKKNPDRMAGAFSAKEIDAFVDRFAKLENQASDVERMKKVAIRKALTAFLVGGGVTGAISAFDAIMAPDVPAPLTTPGGNVSAPEGGPTSPGVPGAPEGVLGKIPTIDTAGEGTDSLFLELKDMLRAQYPDPNAEGVPPMVRHILDPEMHQNELSREFGLAWGTALDGSQSETMFMGNTMTIENGNLVLDQGGVKTVFTMGANGEMVRLDASGAPVPVEAPPSAPASAPESVVSAPEAAAPVATTLPEGVPEGSINFNGQWISPEGVVIAGTTVAEAIPEAPPIQASVSQEEISTMIGGPVPEAPASSVTVSGPETPQSPGVEVVDNSADTLTSAVEAKTEFLPASDSIREVIESPIWGSNTQADSFAVFTMAPPVGSPEAALRTELFDVLRETGIGPRQGESLQNYLARANEVVLNRPEGSGPSTLGIYSSGDRLVAVGGDFNARSVLAYEYMRGPNAPEGGVMVEGPEGSAMRAYTREAIATGVYPPVDMPVPESSALGNKIF
jgi:hypothetical protein